MRRSRPGRLVRALHPVHGLPPRAQLGVGADDPVAGVASKGVLKRVAALGVPQQGVELAADVPPDGLGGA